MVAVHLFHISFWFLKVPSFKRFSQKITPKIPHLKAIREYSSFQKRILNLPGRLRSWKFVRLCIFYYPFGLVWCPSPFQVITSSSQDGSSCLSKDFGLLRFPGECVSRSRLSFSLKAVRIQGESSLKKFQLKGGGTKKSMPETKRVAKNTYSIKFLALQTPRKIQNLFLKRALIP